MSGNPPRAQGDVLELDPTKGAKPKEMKWNYSDIWTFHIWLIIKIVD